MARRPVVLVLWSACWQSVQAGLLEHAIDTVQKTIFPDQQSGNPFASLPAFRNSQVRTINGSAEDPTSMHFRNQDFSIVLGKDGLKTIDSILDRVFNFTTKLQMQRGKFFNLNTTDENSPQNYESPEALAFPGFSKTESNLQPPQIEELKTASHKEDDLFLSPGEKQKNPNSQWNEREVSGASESLKSQIRKRPILTARDAPNYFDPSDGLLKQNEDFNKFTIENLPTTKSSKRKENSVLADFASGQRSSVHNTGKQIVRTEEGESAQDVQSGTLPPAAVRQENDGSSDQLTDDNRNSALDDGARDGSSEDESSRLVALQLPGVGSFVVQKPPEKPRLSVKQRWLLGPLLEPESTNPPPVSSSLVATTKAARFSNNSTLTSLLNQFSSGNALGRTENDSKEPVVLSEPAQSMGANPLLANTVVATDDGTEKDFKLSVKSSDGKLNSLNENETNTAPQVDGELPIDEWGPRFDSLGIPNKVLEESTAFQRNLRRHLPREVLPLALKQQMPAQTTNDSNRNIRNSQKNGKEIGETENFPAKNFSTFSINSPNLENIVIYTNSPNIEVGDLSSTPSNLNTSENENNLNSTGVLNNDELPLYPPLGNFDKDVKLATSEAHGPEVDEEKTMSTNTTTTVSAALSNDNTANTNDINMEVIPVKNRNSPPTRSPISTPPSAAPPVFTTQKNTTFEDVSSIDTVSQGSSYQFYSSPGNTDMYQSATMATRVPNYGSYKSYASPGTTLSTIETQINDFVSGTSSASESSIIHLPNSARSPLGSSYGSPANDATSSSLLGSGSLTWPTPKHHSQDLVLQTRFFDPTLQQGNLRDYLRRIFRLNHLVPIDLNRAIAKLALDESSSFHLNERNSFSRLSPAQQAVLFSLTDYSSPTRTQRFSLTQPRLRSGVENQDWFANLNAEETARSIYEALVSASRQDVQNRPFHGRNNFAPSRERLFLPFNRRSRSLRKL